jgi:hypothetical protein
MTVVSLAMFFERLYLLDQFELHLDHPQRAPEAQPFDVALEPRQARVEPHCSRPRLAEWLFWNFAMESAPREPAGDSR